MQPSPYDRTMARFRRAPVAAAAVVLAFAWIALNVYETAAHWDRFGAGWFVAVTETVSFCASGVFALAGLVWLIERVFGEEPRS